MTFEIGFSIIVVIFAVYLFFRILNYQLRKITLGEPEIVITRSIREVFGIIFGLLLTILSIYYFYDDAKTTKMDYYDIASNIFRLITSFEIVLVCLSQNRFYEKGLLMLYNFITWDEVKNYKFEGVEMNKLSITLRNWKHLTNRIQLQVQAKQHQEVEKYLASKIAIAIITDKQLFNNGDELIIENAPIKSKITLFIIPVIIILLLGLVLIGSLSSQ
jgi:hypothetical protein